MNLCISTLRTGIAVCAVAALMTISGAAHAADMPHKLVVAYVPNWGDVRRLAGAIDYDKLTHINIAFENPTDDTGTLSFDKKDDLLITKAHAKNVKVLISIGGGSASGDKTLLARYFALLTAPQRPGFVARLTDYVVAHHLDGLDVDIEGPSIGPDYGAFITDLSAALKAKGKLLTAALSQGYGGDKVPDTVFTQLDFVNIMAYDGAGFWNPNAPGQHSSIDFAKSNVAYWLDRGLSKDKAVLGVPFYGYGFGKAFREGDYSYSEIVNKYPGAEKLDQVGATIWYNGIPTIQAKAQYVVDNQLAGIMIWSLDADVKGDRSLLDALHKTLTP